MTEMSLEKMFNFFTETENTESFVFNSDGSLPPFPFNLSYSTRIFISILMALVLVGGLHYRMLIFRYLVQPSTNKGPINLLIWIDQLNGLFLAITSIGRIIAFMLPFSMSQLTGETFCRWTPLPGNYELTTKQTSLKQVRDKKVNHLVKVHLTKRWKANFVSQINCLEFDKRQDCHGSTVSATKSLSSHLLRTSLDGEEERKIKA